MNLSFVASVCINLFIDISGKADVNTRERMIRIRPESASVDSVLWSSETAMKKKRKRNSTHRTRHPPL